MLKPRFGSWGRDVLLCRTRAELAAAAAVLPERQWFRATGVLAQELVPLVPRDLRVLVADGRAVGASARVPAPGEWRTNVSLGGHLEPVEPPEEALRLAVAAIAAIGIDFAGVDLLPTRGGGWIVLEVNGAADFDERYSLPGPRRLRRPRRGARARRRHGRAHEPAARPEGLRLPDRALARLRPRLPGRARDLAATRRRRRSATRRASSGSSGGSGSSSSPPFSAACSKPAGTCCTPPTGRTGSRSSASSASRCSGSTCTATRPSSGSGTGSC